MYVGSSLWPCPEVSASRVGFLSDWSIAGLSIAPNLVKNGIPFKRLCKILHKWTENAAVSSKTLPAEVIRTVALTKRVKFKTSNSGLRANQQPAKESYYSLETVGEILLVLHPRGVKEKSEIDGRNEIITRKEDMISTFSNIYLIVSLKSSNLEL